MSQLKSQKKESYSQIPRKPTAVVLLLLAVAAELLADSWGPPSTIEVLSENGQFEAKVIPAKPNTEPVLIVSSAKESFKHEIWRANLCNEIAPLQAFISNDGNTVVTTDNYPKAGYGDKVVALYGRAGLLAKYALEDIAEEPPSSVIKASTFRPVYGHKFPHTKSSRLWQHNSISFFYNTSASSLFCLWLDWENRWIVWNTTNGKLTAVGAGLIRELDAEGRRRALAMAQSNDPSAAALKQVIAQNGMNPGFA